MTWTLCLCLGLGCALLDGTTPDKEPVFQGKSLKEWVKVLQDEESETRCRAARVFANWGPEAKAAVPALAAALRDGGARLFPSTPDKMQRAQRLRLPDERSGKNIRVDRTR